MSAAPAVDAAGLRKRYRALAGLKGVDLQVTRGEIFGQLGPNGAGKTTVIHNLTPQTLTEWQAFMMRPGLFNPDLWFLAFDDTRLVGVCLAFTYPGMGWVRQLAVDPGFQGRGLGSALLAHAFRVFQERGLDQVGLGVAGDNEGAQRFYLRLGMQVKRQYDEYRKELVL